MKLAWRNIVNDRVRFFVAVIGIGFAVFLMIFQGSLLFGFLHAASNLIDSSDAEIWVMARGVACFEFAGPIPRRYMEIVRGIPGVHTTGRACLAFAQYSQQDGKHRTVALVGADSTMGKHFPLPYVDVRSSALYPNGLLVDESNVKQLQASPIPFDVEINKRRGKIIAQIHGFSSFLGCPYVFAAYRDAIKYIDLPPEQSMFLVVQINPNYSADAIKRQIRFRLPDVDVWTREEFSKRARKYWIAQTGAGGAILTAAILGFLIGMMVISQTVYATTMDNIEEFATLKAIGATRSFIVRVVVVQALLCGLAGFLLGAAVSVPLVSLAKAAIAWVYTPVWLPAIILIPTLVMCGLASIMSIRVAVAVEPARVFRA